MRGTALQRPALALTLSACDDHSLAEARPVCHIVRPVVRGRRRQAIRGLDGKRPSAKLSLLRGLSVWNL